VSMTAFSIILMTASKWRRDHPTMARCSDVRPGSFGTAPTVRGPALP
jgi:hypothetical protein